MCEPRLDAFDLVLQRIDERADVFELPHRSAKLKFGPAQFVIILWHSACCADRGRTPRRIVECTSPEYFGQEGAFVKRRFMVLA
jgi:hypothetical protein